MTGRLKPLTGPTVCSRACPADRAWEQIELDRLRAMVMERDVEVAELTSQLEVLKIRFSSMGGASFSGSQGGALKAAAAPELHPPEVHASPDRSRQEQEAVGRSRSRSLEREPTAADMCDAVVETLRKKLAKSEVALRAAQERLVLVEARAAIARQTAGKGTHNLLVSNMEPVSDRQGAQHALYACSFPFMRASSLG